MPHFYVAPENVAHGRFIIRGPEVRHLSTVRRYAAGDEIDLFDGTGRSYRGRIDSVSKDEISGLILHEAQPVQGAVEIHLYQSVPKGDRFDWLVEKAAELGVATLTPLVTERSVIKDFSGAKIERWERLALAACKQCGRAALLKIRRPLALDRIEESLAPGALTVIPWESEAQRTVDDVYDRSEPPRAVNIIIGPEGGFSSREIELAGRAGAQPVTLGPRILRVETAALVAVVLVLELAGEFGMQSK